LFGPTLAGQPNACRSRGPPDATHRRRHLRWDHDPERRSGVPRYRAGAWLHGHFCAA